MALKKQSLFLYGFQVTPLNSSLDFRAVSLGPVLLATLTPGFYSLTALMTEIKRAMQAADPAHTYTVSANRDILGGKQNRVTITTNSAYLDLLFASGPRTASNSAALIGFPVTDQTGATTYTGTSSAGIPLVTELPGYNYLSPDFMHKVQGSVNISASGKKEAVVFQVQQFWQVQFKYEPEAKVEVEWSAFFDWAIQQRLLEFTPDISDPNTVIEGTLEKTTDDGKGLGYKMIEMLPDFPFFYDSGLMTFRVNLT